MKEEDPNGCSERLEFVSLTIGATVAEEFDDSNAELKQRKRVAVPVSSKHGALPAVDTSTRSSSTAPRFTRKVESVIAAFVWLISTFVNSVRASAPVDMPLKARPFAKILQSWKATLWAVVLLSVIVWPKLRVILKPWITTCLLKRSAAPASEMFIDPVISTTSLAVWVAKTPFSMM